MSSTLYTFRLSLIAMFYSMLTNCATVVSDPYQDITIYSSPSEADIFIDGEYRGKTPTTVKVKKKKSALDIMIEKDGYDREATIVNHKIVNPWVFGNILFGAYGLLGVAIDYTSGSLTEFDTERLNVMLEPKTSGKIENDGPSSHKQDKADSDEDIAAKQNASGVNYREHSHMVNKRGVEPEEPKYQMEGKLSPRIGLIVFNNDMHDFINDRIANDESIDAYIEDRSKKVSQVVSLFGLGLEQEAVFEGFPHRLFYGVLPYVGGFDQGFYLLGADLMGGVRLKNGLEFSLGPSYTMIDRSINLGIGYNLDYGALQVPFKLNVNPTSRGSRFSFSTGVSW